MRRLSLLVLSLTLALPAAAQVYQWRDAQGRINYSDTPPPTGVAKAVKPASRPKAPAVDEGAPEQSADAASQKPATEGAADETGKPAADLSRPRTMAEKDAEFRQRKVAAAEAEAKAEKERQRSAELARSCEQARSQIVGLKNSRRITRYNSEGRRELMDDTERTAEIERSQHYVDQNCK